MLKLLLKKQLLEIFQAYFYDAKKNTARSKASTAMYFVLFILLVFGLMGGIFTFLAAKLCTPLVAAGMDWLYFALMGLIAVLLGAFGSVFNTYAGLYLPKDNDLLLSMPVPISALVAARLFGVYLMGLLYSVVVILPAIFVYWAAAGVTLPAVLGGFLMTLLISVFVLTISCLLGWIVAQISQKLKHKSLITVLVSLAVIGAYYFVYFKAQSMIQDLLANAAVYGARIKGAAYPVYLFGSVGVGNVRASVIVSAAVAVLFGLMWVLLSRSFLQIATAAGKVARREYREMRGRQRGVDAALLSREFSRFAASPNYMLNCGHGTFLMPLCAIAVLWKGSELFTVLDVMFAETAGGVPLLLCIVCTEAVYSLHSMQLLMLLLFVGSYVLLMALAGLFVGVKMPTLTWTNEIVPIKQGGAVMVTLFGGFGYVILLFAGFMLLPGWILGFCGYISCFVGVNLLLSVWACLWLRKKGAARFSAL